MNKDAQRNPRLPDGPSDDKNNRIRATSSAASGRPAPTYEKLLTQRNEAWRVLRRYRACYDFLFSHPDLRGEGVAREVGLFLERQTNQFGKESDSLTIEQIASGVGSVNSGTGRNERHIQRKLRLLESVGYVSVTAPDRTSIHRGNTYRINYDSICEWLKKYRGDERVQGDGSHQSTSTNDATQCKVSNESKALAIASVSFQITVESDNTAASTAPVTAINDGEKVLPSADDEEPPSQERRTECNAPHERPRVAVEDVSELLSRLVPLVRDDFSVLGVPNPSTARNVLVAARARVPQASIDEIANWIERKLIWRGPHGPSAFQSWGGVVTAVREDYPTVWEEKRKAGPRSLEPADASEQLAVENREIHAAADNDPVVWALAEYERQFGPVERLTDEIERWLSECASRYPGHPSASSETREPTSEPTLPRNVGSDEDVNAGSMATEHQAERSRCSLPAAIVESLADVDLKVTTRPVPVQSGPPERADIPPRRIERAGPVGSSHGARLPRQESRAGTPDANSIDDGGDSSIAEPSASEVLVWAKPPPPYTSRTWGYC